MLASSGAGPGSAASSSIVVTMDVASSVTLGDDCTDAPAGHRIGTVQPGTPVTTATNGDVCRFTFSSSNDSAMIQMRQLDAKGTAMSTAPVLINDFSVTRMEGVYGLDATRVWATSLATSDVYVTLDGGSTWTGYDTAQGGNKLDVHPVTASLVYIVGQFGRIERSITGGTTWVSQSSPTGNTLRALHMFDASNGVAVGDSGTAVTSSLADTTGGWTLRATCTANALHDLDATSFSNIWAVGSSGAICFSGNGGVGWSSKGSPSAASWRGVAVVDANTVFIAGTDGSMWRTTNATNATPTWTQLNDTHAGAWYDIDAVDANTAWAVGTGGVTYYTWDGGVTNWRETDGKIGGENNAVDAFAGGVAYMSSNNLTIQKSIDAAVSWQVTHAEGAWMNDTWSRDRSGTMVMVGELGKIFRTTNGGSSFEEVASGTTTHLNAVDFDDDGRHGVATGDAGTLLTSSDGGASWTTRTSGTVVDLRGAAVFRDGSMVVVGDSGTVLRSTNQGATWSSVASGTTNTLRGIGATDATGWIAGSSGTLLKTTSSGASWTAQAPGDTTTYRAVAAVDGNVVWIAGSSGMVRRSIDGGTSWQVVTSGSTGIIYDIGALSDEVAWIAGAGTAAYTTDGGSFTQSPGALSSVTYSGVTVHNGASAWISGKDTLASHIDPMVWIGDYGGGNTWAGATSLFGVCLQAVSAQTVPVWTVDAANVPGRCEPLDSDPWRAVTTTTSKIASVANPGDAGRVDLVFGVRPEASQEPGRYQAGVMIEALAPSV